MDRLLFLGVGTIASAVRRALPSLPAAGTTRVAPDQRFGSISPIAANDLPAIRAAAQGANVVVSFPPDENVRSRLVCARSRMRRASPTFRSTAVYPATVGVVTETSAVSDSTERASKRLAAERTWREAGASIVRLPAFYGLSTGLHVSLARGSFRMPGSGSNIVSRVHEDDAARFVCAALRAPPRSLLLAGDDEPAAVADVVEFVCALFGLALPVSSEGEQIPLSLRASRRIDNRATRAGHAIRLAYPSYREGYEAIYTESHGLSSLPPVNVNDLLSLLSVARPIPTIRVRPPYRRSFTFTSTSTFGRWRGRVERERETRERNSPGSY